MIDLVRVSTLRINAEYPKRAAAGYVGRKLVDHRGRKGRPWRDLAEQPGGSFKSDARSAGKPQQQAQGKYRNDETGRAGYDPKVLLKVVLLAYSRGLISSRRIEQACRENVVFIALACGQQPDHSTVAAFVSSMKDEILPIFRDVLLVCEEMNLLGGTMFALDGCKLHSNASKEWSGTFPEFHKKKQKIEAKVAQLLEEQVQADRGQDDPPGPGGSGPSRQQQVEKLHKKAEQIGQWLIENQPKLGAAGRERQSNITDNDSATMMSSHGAVQGYNSQALRRSPGPGPPPPRPRRKGNSRDLMEWGPPGSAQE